MSQLPGMASGDPWDGLVLGIRNWQEEFETSDSKRHKQLRWIAERVSMESGFWLDLTGSFDGHEAAALYGCWMCLCKVAARMPVRGVLVDSRGNQVSPEYCSRVARLPIELFRKLFVWAIERGWLCQPESIVSQPVEKRHTPPNQTQPDETPPPPDNGRLVGEWKDLESRLRACGVELAPETLRESRKLGATARYVSEVITHFETRKGWGPGALRMRLTREGKLGLKPDEGWPKPKPGSQRLGEAGGGAYFGFVPRG